MCEECGCEDDEVVDYDAKYEDLQEERNREATDQEYGRIADIYERKIYGDDLE